MAKPFTAANREEDRSFTAGLYGMPNVYRVEGEGMDAREVPLDGERVMSGELPDSPTDMRPNAAPGNASPFKPY